MRRLEYPDNEVVVPGKRGWGALMKKIKRWLLAAILRGPDEGLGVPR